MNRLNKKVDWIDFSQDRDKWRSLVIMAMNLPVAKSAANFLAD